MPVLRLAIASPLRQLFDYLPPAGLSTREVEALRPGVRLEVPFGRRRACAILVEQVEQSDVAPEKLKPALRCVDTEPLISPRLIELAHWAADYYKYPLGEVLAAALPTSLRQGEANIEAAETRWQLNTRGQGLPPGALARSPRQAQLLALLQREAPLSHKDMEQEGISRAVLRELKKKELVESVNILAETGVATSMGGPTLNTEQRTAVEAMIPALGEFGCFLLDGVTGSGKTEVYFSLIEAVLEAGKQALVLIPEIGLSPQTVDRFRRRFDANIAVLHSGLADGARLRAWQDARSGRAHIVIGTRSAIFASLRNPGLIVVDEEHDASYKQQEGFRYSARDIAVKRAQIEHVPVVLGSATPSLETLANAGAGRYRHLRLRQRALESDLPRISTLDVRRAPLQGGLSPSLIELIRTELEQGNQALLFLNRRGYAPTLQCHDCGFVAGCIHCDARLTLHLRARELRCHHCDWRTPMPRQCPHCNGSQLGVSGVGTEQAEQNLMALFPDYPLYRVDRDSMQRQGAMERVIDAVNQGEPCLLLGTQMLTKGHHFPNVTLVGLLDTDASLFSADFRGAERMGQLLTQVAGRSGRAEKPGQVVIQTHYPDHPLLNTLLQDGYESYAQTLLAERQQSGLPPFGQLLLLRAEARDMNSAETLLGALRSRGEEAAYPGVSFIGPLPAPLQRKSGRFRSQLLVATRDRRVSRALAELFVDSAALHPLGNRLRWSLDVDPQDMM